MKVIELKDVKKSYGKNEILHGISLDIEEGSIHGLVGRNGCGKTRMDGARIYLPSYTLYATRNRESCNLIFLIKAV